MIQLELPGFAPEDFSLKTKDDIIIIEAVHNTKTEDGSSDSRTFTKEFKMRGGVTTEKLSSTYSGGLNEAAHNIQVSASNDKFMIQLELPGFAPEDFSLKTTDDIIIIEAVHNTKTEDGSSDSRTFTKEFKMPGGVTTEKL